MSWATYSSKVKTWIYRKILYPWKIQRLKWHWEWLLARTLARKRCYFGPFTGEFGHLLGHNLPFAAYLHSRGVKVEFCGMEMHRAFFVDEQGSDLTASYLGLRDFFAEFPPSCNMATGLPEDVKPLTEAWIDKAKQSGEAFWWYYDKDLYFYYFRWWLLKKGLHRTYDLSKVYGKGKTDSVVIFPRKWNVNFPHKIDDQTRNNGLNWDYREVARLAAQQFGKVYVIGHPVFTSVEFPSFDNVEVIITNRNEVILEKCCEARMIISQHSGSVYLGEYTDCPVLMIYKGGREIGDLGMTNTFKRALGTKYDFRFAFSEEEIVERLKERKKEITP